MTRSQKVPSTSEQEFPLLGKAGQTPSSPIFLPPASRPHFINSQQFILVKVPQLVFQKSIYTEKLT